MEANLDVIELKQKRKEKMWKAFEITFINPGFVLLVIGLVIFLIVTGDTHILAQAGRITMDTNMIVTVTSMVGVYVVAGIWIVYTKMMEVQSEIRK